MVDPLVIVIDPGHGGRQSYGAMSPVCSVPRGADGKPVAGEALEAVLAEHASHAAAVEKDIVLNVALKLRHALEGCGWPVACELTRESDEGLGLDARGALAAKHGAGLAIILHCDSNGDPRVNGLWTYVRKEDAEGRLFAHDVMLAAPAALKRGTTEPTLVKPPPDWTGRAYNVLSHHAQPAVLIECGFLSHAEDRALLTSEAGQAQVVAAMMSAIAGLWRRAERGAV